jgi:hypothetical protein
VHKRFRLCETSSTHPEEAKMDDKSYSAADANNETAPDTPAGGIVISATGTKDKSKLDGCYFTLSGTTWTLYNKGGNSLTSGQTSQTTFSFQHDALKQNPSNKITWTITQFSMTTNNGITTATGNWSNDDDPDAAEGPQSGSFTASSGGGIDPVSATASA